MTNSTAHLDYPTTHGRENTTYNQTYTPNTMPSIRNMKGTPMSSGLHNTASPTRQATSYNQDYANPTPHRGGI